MTARSSIGNRSLWRHRSHVVWTATVVITVGIGFVAGRLSSSRHGPPAPASHGLLDVDGLVHVDGHGVDPALWHEPVVVLAIAVEALPEDLEAILQELHERQGGRSLRVVGVSEDADPGATRAWVESVQPTFAIIRDAEHGLVRGVRSSGLPEIVILDSCRHLRHLHLGYDDATRELINSEVAELLSHPGPCQP